MDQFTKIFTIATGAALVGLVLYNAPAATQIMKQAGGSLGDWVVAVRGTRQPAA